MIAFLVLTVDHVAHRHLGETRDNVTSPLPAAYGFDETATFNSDADQPQLPNSKVCPNTW